MTEAESIRIVALDGPAGTGKSTVARLVAQRLGLEHLDTGAMYRAVAWACLEGGVAPDASTAVVELAQRLSISVGSQANSTVVYVDGRDVSDAIRSAAVDKAVGPVASNAAVRAELVARQRHWAAMRHGGVLDGRDIATVVFPDAGVKVYLTASAEERARRRGGEHEGAALAAVAADLARRDHVDSTRRADPLQVALGATVLDTTSMSIDEVVEAIVRLAEGSWPTLPNVTGVAPPPPSPPPPPPPSVERPHVVSPLIAPRQRLLYNTVRAAIMAINRGWFKATYDGLHNIPDGPFILSPMHRSYVDTLLVAGVTKRRMRFLGKDTMWKYRWFRPIADGMGGIKIHREATDRESMRLCLAALAAGEPLVIYPEGRRKEGPVVRDLFDGPAYIALSAGVPIVPVGIGGSADAMGTVHKFPRRRHIHVIVGTPLYPPIDVRSKRRAAPLFTAQLLVELQYLFDDAQRVVHGFVPDH